MTNDSKNEADKLTNNENSREITALTGDELTQQQLNAVNGGMTRQPHHHHDVQTPPERIFS